MDSKKVIEFVSYGGIGRAHVAKIIALDLLHKNELQDKIDVVSSGTHVIGIDTNQEQINNYMRKIVGRALKRSLFDTQQKNNLEYAMGEDSINPISEAYNQILPLFKKEEQRYFNEALRKLHINSTSFGENRDPTFKQIFPQNARTIINCFEEDNVTVAKQIYEMHNNLPEIELILVDGKKIEGAFGRDQKLYNEMFEIVKTYVEQNFNKYVEHLLKN